MGHKGRSRVSACLWAVCLAGLSLGAATLVSASSPLTGGLGVSSGGYVTTLFLGPINYQSAGFYYDQSNELRYSSYVFHHGVDISGGCVAGAYPVYAAAEGTVAFAQYINDGYGTQVAIDHSYNTGGNGHYTYTFYSHMGNRTTGARYIVVTPGQYVTAGQLIGYQGNDGSVFGSCNPNPGTHLDWEIRVSDSPVAYGTQMRYSTTAASPDFYTYQQLTYGDPSPATRVVPGPFNGGGGNPTSTPAPPTPDVCGMNFSDLSSTDWAFSYVGYLYCRGVVSGYADGTFRPGNPNTRGQFTKMLGVAYGWQLYNPYFASFTDVPPSNNYYQYVETAYLRGLITGYPCGGPGEPCDSQRRPYFRLGSNVTRGQAAKMLVITQGWPPVYPSRATFPDVPADHWSFGYVEAAFRRGVITGMGDGTFRPNGIVTRAQLSKMLSLTMQQGMRR